MATEISLQVFICHCAAVRSSAWSNLDKVLYHGCSICWKSGHLHIMKPHGFDLQWLAQGVLTTYHLGRGNLLSDFCSTCDCLMRVRFKDADATRALNVRIFQALWLWSLILVSIECGKNVLREV